MTRPMSRPMIPSTRIGWRDAAKLIKEGWKVSVLPDGHAELLSPPGEVVVLGKGHTTHGRCAIHYLTRRSVELLGCGTRRHSRRVVKMPSGDRVMDRITGADRHDLSGEW